MCPISSQLRRWFDTAFPPTEVEDDKNLQFRTLPIISGIIIPFAILLGIPSLTGRWYVRTESNRVVESRPNTPILQASLIISLTFAILANICMVIRYAERGVRRMTVCAIGFLTVHDILNIITVVTFGVEHRSPDGFTYGQPFWMTVCSTAISLVTNVTLVVDYVKTPDFSRNGSGLTFKQRGLIIVIIVLLTYIALGALVESFLLHLSFIDALYFVVVSIETVGLGDIHPDSTGSIVFTMFYIAFGIMTIGLLVSAARDALLEGIVAPIRHTIREARLKDREQRIRTQWRRAVEYRLRTRRLSVWVAAPNPPSPQPDLGVSKQGPLRHLRKRITQTVDPSGQKAPKIPRMRLNVNALPTEELETAALEAGAPLEELIPAFFPPSDTGQLSTWRNTTSREPWYEEEIPGISSLTLVRLAGMARLLASSALALAYGANAPSLGKIVDEEELAEYYDTGLIDRGEDAISRYYGPPISKPLVPLDTATLTRMLRRDARVAFRIRVAASLSLFIVFWMVGAAIFNRTESWSFGDAVYFCFITFTTVGYGDFAPRTIAGRSIFVAWALVGIATMTILIAVLSEAFSSRYKRAIQAELSSKSDDTSSTLVDTRESMVSEVSTRNGAQRTISFARPLPTTISNTTSRGMPSEHLGRTRTKQNRPRRSRSLSPAPRRSRSIQSVLEEGDELQPPSGQPMPISILQQVRGIRELVRDAIVVTRAQTTAFNQGGGTPGGVIDIEHILEDVDRRLLALVTLEDEQPPSPSSR